MSSGRGRRAGPRGRRRLLHRRVLDDPQPGPRRGSRGHGAADSVRGQGGLGVPFAVAVQRHRRPELQGRPVQQKGSVLRPERLPRGELWAAQGSAPQGFCRKSSGEEACRAGKDGRQLRESLSKVDLGGVAQHSMCLVAAQPRTRGIVESTRNFNVRREKDHLRVFRIWGNFRNSRSA